MLPAESKSGINAKSMIDHNRSLVLRYLIKRGVCSRADIAKETGLTAASISKITSSLIRQQVLLETDVLAGVKGRKAIGLALNQSRFKVVGVNFTRRTFSIGVFDLGGNQFDGHTEVVPLMEGGLQCLNRIRALIEGCIDKYPEIAAVGMAVPGPYLKRKGRIAIMTNAPDWQTIDFEKEFRSVRGRPVFFEHDANAAALAEWYFNSDGADKSTLIYFMLDDGIGAGVVQDGVIFEGFHGYAGEIGHISIDINGPQCQCGNRGCLEMYCSALAFVRQAKQRLPSHPESSLSRLYEFDELDVFDAAKNGDAYANELMAELGFYIGCGVISLIFAFSPSVVILGSRMAQGGQLMMEHVRNTLQSRLNHELLDGVAVKLSMLRADPVLTGAATVAVNQLLLNLSTYVEGSYTEEVL